MPRKLTQDEVIEKARAVHGNQYDYSKVKYENMKTRVEIICSKHGSFDQTLNMHISRQTGCPKCGYDRGRKARAHTASQFVSKAQAVHGYVYDYSNVKYENLNTKVEIICRGHDSFWQRPKDHIYIQTGCPKCARERTESKGAAEVRLNLEKFDVNFEVEKTFEDLRNPDTDTKLRLDFYLPEIDVAIEFDGDQHFKQDNGIWNVEGLQMRDDVKDDWCAENDVHLIRFNEDERKSGFISKTIKKLFG